MSEGFVHLHTHSVYSLLDGYCPVDKLLERARQLGMEALALTDHGNLYGAVEFSRKAKQLGIKPIIGCEVYVAPGSRFSRDPGESKAYHLVLLAKNEVGYRNLVSLVSKAHLEGFYYKPRVDKDLLREKSSGLIGLSACLSGEIAGYLLNHDYQGAREVAKQYQQIFGLEDFYLELQNQNLPEQVQVNAGLVQISRDIGVPLVATNDAHYLFQEDAKAHDCLLCIGTGSKLGDTNRLRFPNDQFYFKSPQEMAESFRDFPEAIDNTAKIAARCQFELELGGMYLPVFTPPEGAAADDYLCTLCEEAIPQKYGKNPPREVAERLQQELEIIQSLGYSDYFLIVWDFIRFARESDIPVGPGRGSAAGSLAAYLLGITGIDPLKYNLLFERFLNPERVTMPDIDIDFDYERRGEVIEYVREKYGAEKVAQIITFGTLQARAAIRDVGRVLDWAVSRVDQLAKLVPAELGITLQDALVKEPRLAAMYQQDSQARQLLDLARAIEGMPRHASTHAAGVVIGAGPLDELVPLQQGSEEGAITQFDMGSLEAIGLLKMDFLGLRTLTVVDTACWLIQATTGESLDLDSLTPDDPRVYEMLSQGEAQGVFQMESRLFHRLLLQVKPTSFEDLIALISLGRPGPMNMVPDFAARKHGQAPVEYLHPKLEPILKETYGIMVYQEQVMRIASDLAGFSLGEADLLRRAMGKKKIDVLLSMKDRFLQGASEGGVDVGVAEKIFESMEYFANYGFNKSHAAAYAMVSYWTAYLRRYYPIQFFAALLTSVRGNTDKLRAYLFTAANSLGIDILPPDVNRSSVHFSVEDNHIRFGLGAIKNVGEGAAAAIIAERNDHGEYASLENLCSRIPGRLMNKSTVENLVKSGACDGLAPSRNLLLANYELTFDRIHRQQVSQAKGQVSLFGGLGEIEREPVASGHPAADLLALEKEALGLYLSGHPITKWRDLLKEFVTADLSELEEWQDKKELVFGAVVGQVKVRRTKKGHQMARVQLEDEKASVETIVFPSVFQKRAPYLVPGAEVIILGRAEIQDEGVQVIVSEVIPLDARHVVVYGQEEFARLDSSKTGTNLSKPALLKVKGAEKDFVFTVSE